MWRGWAEASGRAESGACRRCNAVGLTSNLDRGFLLYSIMLLYSTRTHLLLAGNDTVQCAVPILVCRAGGVAS